MVWESIQDLPSNWQLMTSIEVESLAEAWFNTYQSMPNSKAIETFNERLRREWSIETGIIEKLYTIDQGTTKLLIEQGIDAALIPNGATDRPVTEVIQIIKAQRDALDGLYSLISEERELSVHFIRSLHQLLLRNEKYIEAYDQFGNLGLTEIIKGDWRKNESYTELDTGLKHYYCQASQIQSEMDRLVELHNQHNKAGVSPMVEAAWLHHRFTQIHPFQDGNGRVARCLATLVLLRSKQFPLVVTRDHRVEYIASLREADEGNLTRLVQLFNQILKRAYIQALDLSEDVLQIRTPVNILIGSIANRYRERQSARFDKVFDVALKLQQVAKEVLDRFAADMKQQFYQMNIPIFVRSGINDLASANWYPQDIVETAGSLGYYANLTRPRLWARLRIKDEGNITSSNAAIIISFHYLGKEDRGVMAVSAFLNITHPENKQQAVESEDDTLTQEMQTFRETHTIVSDAFTFAFTDVDRVDQRRAEFQLWVEQAVTVGLAEWQRQI